MARQSKPQKETVRRVMHAYKHGELESGGGGKPVRKPRQAIAIALSEAGASRNQSPPKKERLTKTKSKERKGQTAEAQKERRGAQKAGTKSGGGRRAKSR